MSMTEFTTVLETLRIHGMGACVTSVGSMDGLGNSMQRHNAIMTYANAHPGLLKYVYSPLHIEAHGSNDSFTNIFYDQRRDNECYGRPITAESTVELKCPLSLGTGGCRMDTLYSPVADPFHGMVFSINLKAGTCCKKDVKFVDNRAAYYDRYWAPDSLAHAKDKGGYSLVKPDAQWTKHPRIAIHLRNGDTVALNNTKRRGYADAFLCHVPVLSRIPQATVHIVTEMADEENVVALKTAFEGKGMPVTVEAALRANEALRFLAGADVLLVNEHSSFGLLAAVLSREAAVVVVGACGRHAEVEKLQNRIGRPFVHTPEMAMAPLRHKVGEWGHDNAFFGAKKDFIPPRYHDWDDEAKRWVQSMPLLGKHAHKVLNPLNGKLEKPRVIAATAAAGLA